MTVGCLEDAALALRGNQNAIGEGCSRIVYLINGVVYKVQKSVLCTSNYNEWSNYQNWSASSLPEKVRLPETHLWVVNDTDVIAMQYIVGEPDWHGRAHWAMLFSEDGMYENIIINEEGYWLVDMEI